MLFLLQELFLAHQARATSALWAEVADPLAEAADELALSSIATSVNQQSQVHDEVNSKLGMSRKRPQRPHGEYIVLLCRISKGIRREIRRIQTLYLKQRMPNQQLTRISKQ